MQLSQIINLNSVYIDSISQSKTAVLFKISKILSHNASGLNPQDLFDAYWKRESMGSTAIGQGVTIPHIRLNGLSKPSGCLIRLLKPVDFGAEDKQPVDLVIGFMVPQEQIDQHLKILAAVIKQFSIPAFRNACRRINNSDDLYQLLIGETIVQEELIA